jgi:hypothetical protein
MRCKAHITGFDGKVKRCGLGATKDSEYCFHHTPGANKKWKAAMKKGGKRGPYKKSLPAQEVVSPEVVAPVEKLPINTKDDYTIAILRSLVRECDNLPRIPISMGIIMLAAREVLKK